ncbi:zinc ribbon domain-containing protein [Arcanobacterium hippocoleae]|uniref:zinc ribbon domain-containing protein n=1 Tax=Arcanobacterium hippocoleae TaxID=149017 RepID=UPI00333F998D
MTGSHPAIIDPETWELAQAEFNARGIGRRERVFTGKIFCTHCAHTYGSKTWHSTDAYKTVIWQCNHKYRSPHPAQMPILRDEQLEHIFLTALATLLKRRNLIDWDLLETTLTDTTELEATAITQAAEIEACTKLIRQAISANATQAQDQSEYQARFDQLEARQQQAIDAYNATQAEIERRKGLKAELAKYRRNLTDLDTAGEFSPATFHALCQRINITPDGHAAVMFKDGTEIETQ